MCIYICIYIYMYISIHMYINPYIQIHICMCIYICTYIYHINVVWSNYIIGPRLVRLDFPFLGLPSFGLSREAHRVFRLSGGFQSSTKQGLLGLVARRPRSSNQVYRCISHNHNRLKPDVIITITWNSTPNHWIRGKPIMLPLIPQSIFGDTPASNTRSA